MDSDEPKPRPSKRAKLARNQEFWMDPLHYGRQPRPDKYKVTRKGNQKKGRKNGTQGCD
jgi:hypothetical protein